MQTRRMFAGEVFDLAERFAADADGILAAIADPEQRARERSAVWKRSEALGLSTVLIPECDDGAGGTLLDLAAAIEGFGTHALPVPATAAYGVTISALVTAGASSTLRSIAAGTVTVLPVFDALAPYRCGHVGTGVEHTIGPSGVTIHGAVLGIEDVPTATHLLVASRDQNGEPALILVERASVSEASLVRMDDRSTVDVAFAGVATPLDAVVATGDLAERSVASALLTGALLVAVEVVAALGPMIAETIEYLGQRQQFDVPLASFQVLRHHVADMYVAYDNLNALTEKTVALAARGEATESDIRLLKVRVGDVARQAAHTAIQLHGGMGITEELHATRLAKRLLVADYEYGDGAHHTQRLIADTSVAALGHRVGA